MKNIFLRINILLFFTFIHLVAKAQEKKRYIDTDLDKFVGTWIYAANGKEFKLILKKEIIENKEVALEFITGYHSYTINRKMIDGYTQPVKNTISFGVIVREPIRITDQLNFDLAETTAGTRFKGELKFIKGKPDQLSYLTKYHSPPSSYNLKDQLPESLLPKEVIFKRVK